MYSLFVAVAPLVPTLGVLAEPLALPVWSSRFEASPDACTIDNSIASAVAGVTVPVPVVLLETCKYQIVADPAIGAPPGIGLGTACDSGVPANVTEDIACPLPIPATLTTSVVPPVTVMLPDVRLPTDVPLLDAVP